MKKKVLLILFCVILAATGLAGCSEEKEPVEAVRKTVVKTKIIEQAEDFEDVIRTAVSLGGDCDTLTAIAGSIAEAYYGIPPLLKYEAYRWLDDELNEILWNFEQRCHFNEGVAYKYHPLFWFVKKSDQEMEVQRAFKGAVTMSRDNEGFHTSQQALDGWRRALLYMDLLGVWDSVAMGAMMRETLAYGPFTDTQTGKQFVMTFTSAQHADEGVYPFLPKEQVEEVRANVELFYESPSSQVVWQNFILHPVAIAITRDGTTYPIRLNEIEGDWIHFAEHKLFSFVKLGNEEDWEWKGLWEE